MKTFIISFVCVLVFICTHASLAEEKKDVVWSVEKKGVTVSLSEEICPFYARYVLSNLIDDSNAGVFDWRKMKDVPFRNIFLSIECLRLQGEEIYRKLGKDLSETSNSKMREDIKK